MRLYSYVVARDYGFAPNPFSGYCTLATCKPEIRRLARSGDWIVGTGSQRYRLRGHLVYAMRVGEALSYDDYWSDPRFMSKRPNLRCSLKQAFGDNIYHHDGRGGWRQENSHHSHENGEANRANLEHDTQTDRVLVSDWFVYFGKDAPKIPNAFQKSQGESVCAHRGHRSRFSLDLVNEFIVWVQSLGKNGFIGEPIEFSRQLTFPRRREDR